MLLHLTPEYHQYHALICLLEGNSALGTLIKPWFFNKQTTQRMTYLYH